LNVTENHWPPSRMVALEGITMTAKTRTAPVEQQEAKERKLLKPRKFREKYGISPTTLWRRLRDGSLAYIEIGPQKFIIEPDEVKRAARPE
jgi:hypothetical protein